MFFDVMWVAFLVELFFGIVIGWFFASFFNRRQDSFEDMWARANTKGTAINQARGPAVASRGYNNQGTPPEAPALQQQVARLEQSLAQTETKLKKANADWMSCQDTLSRNSTHMMSLQTEMTKLRDQLSLELATKSALDAQVEHWRNEATNAQSLAQALEASRADLNKTVIRLQDELETTKASQERLLAQIAVYKNKMRVVGALDSEGLPSGVA